MCKLNYWKTRNLLSTLIIRKAVGNVLKGVGCIVLIKKVRFEQGLEFGEGVSQMVL